MLIIAFPITLFNAFSMIAATDLFKTSTRMKYEFGEKNTKGADVETFKIVKHLKERLEAVEGERQNLSLSVSPMSQEYSENDMDSRKTEEL
ncbi:hypothetical protein PsorP6_001015 [Peronosclerospora sorghi]|uniref:Uncharacterized protein n=1 Tax=Peronosclerospora sorghi TaxID=230839 RepID=A0ACC0WWR0_9STRA|nr:hypothetical protein PsorP6_001015 [Peronosclerospora sorghi]